jgi:hypothetical protein
MKKYKIDESTIWEETGKITVHNYPPSPMTYSYVTKIYREIKRDKLGYKIVEGSPIYFNDMKPDEISFAKIIAECENNLFNKLWNKEKFEEINDFEYE